MWGWAFPAGHLAMYSHRAVSLSSRARHPCVTTMVVKKGTPHAANTAEFGRESVQLRLKTPRSVILYTHSWIVHFFTLFGKVEHRLRRLKRFKRTTCTGEMEMWCTNLSLRYSRVQNIWYENYGHTWESCRIRLAPGSCTETKLAVIDVGHSIVYEATDVPPVCGRKIVPQISPGSAFRDKNQTFRDKGNRS